VATRSLPYVNRAGLRPAFPLFFDKLYFGADSQAVECSSENAVAMKVHRPTIGGVDTPIVVRRVQFGHDSVGLFNVRLHLLIPLALVVLELPPGSAKGVSKRDISVFV
jgi:hypothetical protein